MKIGKIKTHSLKEIARLEGVNPRTITNNPQDYIPISVYTATSRRAGKGYIPHYIRMKDINNMLMQKKLIKKIGQKTKNKA